MNGNGNNGRRFVSNAGGGGSGGGQNNRGDGAQRGGFNAHRRNAVFGNLKYYKPRGPQLSGSGGGDDVPQSNGHASDDHDHRTSGHDNAGFRQRNRVTFKHTTHSNSRYHLNNRKIFQNVLKDEDDDTIMNNNQGTSAGLHRDNNRLRQFKSIKTRNIDYKNKPAMAGVRIKSTQPLLKIGDSTTDEAKAFPPSQPFCKLTIIDQNIFDLCVNFLQQYFTCFDKNREELLAAYHKRSIFSLSVNTSSVASYRNVLFGDYFRESRNLLYVKSAEKSVKMLHIGNIDIVAFLNRLPDTEHDCNTLKLDTSYFAENMLKLSVLGIFREGKPTDKVRPMRSFQRVFICVPVDNARIAIVNEHFTISNPSIEQSKMFKEEASKNQMEVIPAQQPSSMSSNNPSSLTEAQIKEQMIAKFFRETSLTLTWSKDCLEYADWDYNKALVSFLEHKKDIPPEAFVR